MPPSIAALALGASACGTGDVTGITPITGIVVRADTLVSGHGCGTGPDQVYKYAAVVSTVNAAGVSTAFVAGGVYDCFADATFVNLCAATTGSFTYAVDVSAFTRAQWLASGQSTAGSVANGLSSDPSSCPPDAGAPPPVGPDAGITVSLGRAASFTTRCSATQQSNIEVVAVCGALTAP